MPNYVSIYIVILHLPSWRSIPCEGKGLVNFCLLETGRNDYNGLLMY